MNLRIPFVPSILYSANTSESVAVYPRSKVAQ
jgi:hypothetical protein